MKVFFSLTALCLSLAFFSCSDGEAELVNPEPEPNPKPETEKPQPPQEVVTDGVSRGLIASINGRKDASHYPDVNSKILVSWRLFPGEGNNTGFDLYRQAAGAEEVKLNTSPITRSTNWQDAAADPTTDNTYRLCAAGSTETLDSYTLPAAQASQGLPYVSIPLQSGQGIVAGYDFKANDATIGDVDGDGRYEIILKRLAESANTQDSPYHNTMVEVYRTDGTFLWRMLLGPNINGGNTTSMAVADFDGDGRAEIAVRTAEGTLFGDGKEIGDTNGDGKTDYRVAGANYVPGCPSFLSIIEGATGRELARADYIAAGQSTDWGDDYWKRASSIRVGVGSFSGTYPSVLICRGVYAKSVLEAWDYRDGELTKRWRFDTTQPEYREWEGQGNHSLAVGDVDGDGCDEVVYGGMCVDHNGKGLWLTGHGHGDALHLGKFDPARSGLQIWSCFEACPFGVAAALRDAKTGETIWDYKENTDMGRCLVADIDPESPGCEMWWYKGNVHSATGRDLGYAASSYNMAIWFDGTLNRQLYDRSTIHAPKEEKGRVFTLYRYDVVTINGTKENPCFYGDLWGDWREEVIQVTDDNKELRIFTTWYPTEYKLPYLMSDHLYEMSALNQNIGYNMPTQLGYYLEKK